MTMMKHLILVVEDDFQNRQMISIYLQRSGFDVELASNGHEALEKLKGAKPDLIISDISMPHMDGFQLYQAVKEVADYRTIPFIFLTAHSDADRRRHSKELGSDDFLTKPIELEDLLVTVRGRMKRVREIQTTMEEQMRSELDDIKRTILSTLTHEVNTPLFIIKLTANLLLDESMQFQPTELRELLQRIKRSGDRLDALLRDFLVTTRIAGGEAHREFEESAQPLNINHILNHLQIKFQKMVEPRTLTLYVDLAPTLPDVRMKMDQIADVAERVMQNAVKFTNEKGEITIRTYARDGKVVMEIRDTGIGMETQEIPKIFDKFYQIDRAKSEQQGAGLGLTIAQALVRIHGGTIEVESEKGKGSTFRVVLPACS